MVLEGKRLMKQLASWGIMPLELYLREEETELKASKTYIVSSQDMERICSSEHPPELAGLYPLPEARTAEYQLAFYLENIADPGNLGTIFRIASAFGIDCLLLSPHCCEVSSPKVIRASLGAVYRVPFAIGELNELLVPGTKLAALVMDGSVALQEYKLSSAPTVFALGSEAHGLSPETLAKATETIRITMRGGMESLNAAVCAGIVAYQLSGIRK